MDTGEKDWATKYLLDPLNAPEPSAEDGPGNSFRPGGTVPPVRAASAASKTGSISGRRLSKTNPYRKASLSSGADVKRSASLNSPNGYSPNANRGAYPPQSYPSPPPSASPTGVKQSPTVTQTPVSPRMPTPQSPRSPNHRQEAFGGSDPSSPTGRRRRGSSLSERFPGDMSHRPLDQLAKEKHVADRARYATKKHHIQPDTIDSLDLTGGGAYHHGGPYDATLFARNNSTYSPLAAIADSNAEALKATPKEKIIDSLEKHRPLDGVAAFASGDMDRNGTTYNYEEGENTMTEANAPGGAYKRWPGVQYDDNDIKGKGEPSYSIEKALKEHHIRDNDMKKDGVDGIEMKTHSRNASGNQVVDRSVWDDGEGMGSSGGVGRSGSFSKRLSGGLKKRFGSIKRKDGQNEQGRF